MHVLILFEYWVSCHGNGSEQYTGELERESLGENEAISRLAKHKVSRNNTKRVECCELFSNCTFEQDILPKS